MGLPPARGSQEASQPAHPRQRPRVLPVVSTASAAGKAAVDAGKREARAASRRRAKCGPRSSQARASSGRELRLRQALLEETDPVLPPEKLAPKGEDRDAEDAVGVRLLDRRVELAGALPRQEVEVRLAREAELRDEPRDLGRHVDL